MLNLNHKKLEVWEKSLLLNSEVYQLTKNYPSEERFNLVSQMRRASVSITSNIAEGASRISSKERKRFYEISRSSLVEIDAQVEISLNLSLIELGEIKQLEGLANEIFAMLTAMISNC